MDSNHWALVTQTFLLSQRFIIHNTMRHSGTHTHMHKHTLTCMHTRSPSSHLSQLADGGRMRGESWKETRRDSWREQLCFHSGFNKFDVTEWKKKKRMPGLPGTTLLLSEQMLGHVSVLTNVDQILSPSVSLWQPLYVGHFDSWQVDPSLVFEAMICKDAQNFPQRFRLIWTWAHHVNSLSGSRNRYEMILTYDGALSCWRQPSEDCTVFIKRWSWSTTILREAVVKKKKYPTSSILLLLLLLQLVISGEAVWIVNSLLSL